MIKEKLVKDSQVFASLMAVKKYDYKKKLVKDSQVFASLMAFKSMIIRKN